MEMFAGKVVIVTGSSAGIGAGLAERFAKEGASGLVIHGRKEAALQEVKKRCEKVGSGKTKVHIVIGDISSEDIRQKLVNEAIQHFGKLDVLINNAAIYFPNTFLESTMDIFDKVFDVNVRSMIALCQIAAPHLIESKGNIINVSSENGLMPGTRAIFYTLTKAVVDHFTKCLAVELGPKGVRVNAINPGYIPETDVLTRIGISDSEQQSYVKMASEGYPLGRPGTVEEVSDVVMFIASDKASFVTGNLVPIEGGNAAKVARN